MKRRTHREANDELLDREVVDELARNVHLTLALRDAVIALESLGQEGPNLDRLRNVLGNWGVKS